MNLSGSQRHPGGEVNQPVLSQLPDPRADPARLDEAPQHQVRVHASFPEQRERKWAEVFRGSWSDHSRDPGAKDSESQAEARSGGGRGRRGRDGGRGGNQSAERERK